jgi:hypothetical protein
MHRGVSSMHVARLRPEVYFAVDLGDHVDFAFSGEHVL